MVNEQVDQAYPLVQLLAPELTLERWREFAHAFTAPPPVPPPRRGIVVLADSAGYFFGLFSYLCGIDLLSGPTLLVDNLVIVQPVTLGEAARLAESEIGNIAHRLGCCGVQVRFALARGRNGGLARHFADRGYRASGTIWWRPLWAAGERRVRD